MNIVEGFSKLDKQKKIQLICESLGENNTLNFRLIDNYWHPDFELQKTFEEFSENTVSNFFMPYGIAPNFLINGQNYFVPMVIEESSVVAAASKAAKFWSSRGGFKSEIISTAKVGQVHFLWQGSNDQLTDFFYQYQNKFLENIKDITSNMEKRGGGVLSLELVDKTQHMPNYYQLDVKFETCDAMGANFINSVLERLAQKLKDFATEHFKLAVDSKQLDVIMSILSNYTPECLVKVQIRCSIEKLDGCVQGMDARQFANRFKIACDIAKADVNRAVTHNKGIFNGIDAVVMATGNDFRAIESCGHAYAARDGQYRGLSNCIIENDEFIFELTIPLAVGTVGGLTTLHPLAKASQEVLGHPDAKKLMQIIASVGLAQNFSALRSLVSSGIQKGHMKIHLLNILKQLRASESEITHAKKYFADKVVSFTAVRDFLNTSRQIH